MTSALSGASSERPGGEQSDSCPFLGLLLMEIKTPDRKPISEETRSRMRVSAAKRCAAYLSALLPRHPCLFCGNGSLQFKRKYCNRVCYGAASKGRKPWNTGKKLSEAHRNAVSASLIGNHRRLGKPHADWERHKMSLASKGKPKSEAHRKAMSEASLEMAKLGLKSTMLGKKHSPESLAKMNGRKRSLETRQRMTESLLAGYRSGRHKIQPGYRRFAYQDRFGRDFMMRSKWEMQVAKQLDEDQLTWRYEPDVIHLPDGRNYIPDFWVVELNSYLEVKGWTGGNRLEKVQLAQQIGTPVELIVDPANWRTNSAVYIAYAEQLQASA